MTSTRRRVTAISLLLILGVSLLGNIRAGDRLSALSSEDDHNDYYVILRKVFHRIYEDDIRLSAITAIGTGTNELATGMVKAGRDYSAFSAFPSASVWSTEYDRFMADMKETCYDAVTNKEIPCPPPKCEKGLPKSYRGIKVSLKTRPLRSDLAMRISSVWEQGVQQALQAPLLDDSERGAFGGLVHYYSARSTTGAWLTAIGSSRDEANDAERMAELAIALQGYAVHAVSERELKKALITVEQKSSTHAMP